MTTGTPDDLGPMLDALRSRQSKHAKFSDEWLRLELQIRELTPKRHTTVIENLTIASERSPSSLLNEESWSRFRDTLVKQERRRNDQLRRIQAEKKARNRRVSAAVAAGFLVGLAIGIGLR